ncbi:hypothetical protein MHK_003582 [Candidatus Magnetomorum sp. HK-1]|nr:hypothetical protein MHK_003582 [Candidatus Magnetomorum sp. HK-1]
MIPITTQLLTKTENNSLRNILKSISDNQCVFIIGPRGMGKSLMVQAAYQCVCASSEYDGYYFDIEKIGPGQLYERIAEKVAPNSTFYGYIADFLNDNFYKNTVLFFDKFRVLKDLDFYYRFMNDCMKIHNEGKAYPGSGKSKIVMVFNSSILYAAQPNIPTLWDHANKIEIKPLDKNSIKEIVINAFAIEEVAIENEKVLLEIYELSSGHRFLSRCLTYFYINQGPVQVAKQVDIKMFIDHIWHILHHPDDKKLDIDDELCKHFKFIIQLVESSAELIISLIKIIYEKKLPKASIIPFYDKLTISGILKKN